MIETPRLFLRHFVESDLDDLADLMADKDFMRFSNGTFTREQTGRFLLDRLIAPARTAFPAPFAILPRTEQQLLGYCGFFCQVVDGKEELELGYRVHPAYWNRGLATEAARAVTHHGFEVLGLDRTISLIHPDNHASRRVAEKNGMTLERATTFKGFPTLLFSVARRTAKARNFK